MPQGSRHAHCLSWPSGEVGGCSWGLMIQEKSCFLLGSRWRVMDCPGAPRGVFTLVDLQSSSDSWPGGWVTMDSGTSSLWGSAKGVMRVGSACLAGLAVESFR